MKTLLLTGATDGIGRLTAQRLVEAGHRVLLHGRNPDKLRTVAGGSQTLIPLRFTLDGHRNWWMRSKR